jgi:hypothetical protein
MTYETAFQRAKERTAAGTPTVPIHDRTRPGGWRTAHVAFSTPINWQRVYSAKVTPEIVRQIREQYANGAAMEMIGQRFSLSLAGVFNIVRRKYWKDVA